MVASNLWELNVDDVTGVPRSKPRRLTDWSGFLVYDISATSDGKLLRSCVGLITSRFLQGTWQTTETGCSTPTVSRRTST